MKKLRGVHVLGASLDCLPIHGADCWTLVPYISQAKRSSGCIYESMNAFSPGLWADAGHDMWAWSLVLVQPLTGTVTKQCDIAPRGIFQRYYGGSVFQGSSNPDGFLYHVLRVMYSEANFIVGVNSDTCEVRFSEVANLRHVHSLQLVNPAPAPSRRTCNNREN